MILVQTGNANFGFINGPYLQNVVFSFEKGLNSQYHSLADFLQLMRKSLPSPKFPIPSLGREIPAKTF